MRSDPEIDRFRSGVEKYAAFLETVEGRLRFDLTLANLLEFLAQPADLQILDLGCGTGGMAIRLAQMGHQVTLLDSSEPMLEFAEDASQQAGVREKLQIKHGDASEVSRLLPGQLFDVILCHNVLEYVEDPGAILGRAGGALRDGSSVISVLVRSRVGDVLKAALREGDLEGAEQNLTAAWGYESLYGGRVRLFGKQDVRDMLAAASLETSSERGVRVISDYLPPKVAREQEYQRIFALERKLGAKPELAAIARYTHCIVRRGGVAREGIA